MVPPACWTLSASASTSALEDSIDCAFASHSWASRTSFSASAASAESRNSGTDRGVVSSARRKETRASCRAARLQENRHERAQDLGVVRRHLQRLLVNLDRLVEGAALAQEARDDRVLLEGVDLAARLRVEVRQLDVQLDVRRVRLRHLLVDPDGGHGVVVLRVVVREDLVLALRLRREALLRVQLGEPLVDVEAGRIQPVDLLVDRDAAQEEAVAREVLGDLREVRDGLLVPVQAREEVTHLVQDVDVAGNLLEDLLVVLERRVDLSLRQGFLGRSHERVALACHDRGYAALDVPRRDEDAVERQPVLRRRAVTAERGDVLGRRISPMRSETVERESASSSSSMRASRSTFATIEAAAIAATRPSPRM